MTAQLQSSSSTENDDDVSAKARVCDIFRSHPEEIFEASYTNLPYFKGNTVVTQNNDCRVFSWGNSTESRGTFRVIYAKCSNKPTKAWILKQAELLLNEGIKEPMINSYTDSVR